MAHQTYPIGLPAKQTQAQSTPLDEEAIILTDAGGDKSKLSLENGDLIVTALSGPNQGKKCNLTYGRWT